MVNHTVVALEEYISVLKARIAEYRELLDLACRQAECEMLLTGDEIRRIRAALEKP